MSCEHCTRVALTEAERSEMRHLRKTRTLGKQVAWELGITSTTLSRWEIGETRPTIDQHRRWIRALAAPD
jgi:DNA-binding transcriptional regulator YiaG